MFLIRKMGGKGGRKGSGEEEKKNIWGVEMASKGPAVTMVLLSLVTVGTDLPQC